MQNPGSGRQHEDRNALMSKLEKGLPAEKICRSKKTVDIPFKRVYFGIKKSGCKR